MSVIFHEKRSVCYVAPSRVVWQSPQVKDAARLLETAGETATIWRDPGMQLPPGGAVILEYDTPLPLQGIRVSRGYDGFGPAKVLVRLGESVSEVLHTPNNDHSMHEMELTLSHMGISRIGNAGFRFLRLENLEADPKALLNLRECSAEAWIHPAKRVGSFQCSDPLLNQIFEACAVTLEKCISPLLLDGTKRDRLVWMGDLYNEIRACGVLFPSHDAIPESLEFLNVEGRRNRTFNGIVSYTAYWFLALREYHRFYRDTDFLLTQRDNLHFFANEMLQTYEKDPDSVLQETIVDWATPEGCPKNAYGPLYLAAVIACRELAGLLQENELLLRCQKTEDSLRNAIHLEPGAPKSVYAWGALTGLVTPTQALERLLQDPEDGWSPFHFDNFLRTYSLANKTAEGLALLRKYYGGMLHLGARTIWEQYDMPWEVNATPIDQMPQEGKTDIHLTCGRGCFQGLRNSLCHGWGASPAAWLIENIAGITPIGDGYQNGVQIAPNLCGLDFLAVTCPTPKGNITLLAQKGKKTQLTVPQGMPYTLVE